MTTPDQSCPVNRVILFGGQGSTSVFSLAASSAARQNATSSAAGAILLSRCHAAFLEDYQSLDQQAKNKLGLDISKFHRPDDFLTLKNSNTSHGLVEATTICIYQLLHYLAEQERSDEDFSSWTQTILETTGFCSGLITAAVVASSKSSTDFVNFGVEAFRLAFWIGCRTSFESEEIYAARGEDNSWSLVVLGLDLTQVEQSLERFREETKLQTLRVSAISSATVISLTGPGPDLSVFRKFLESGATTKFAHVHAWYHAGEQLEGAVASVLQDVEQRNIGFPSMSDLERPLRSPHNGRILDSQGLHDSTLAEWVIRHMLIYPVDWVRVSRSISAKIAENLEDSTKYNNEIISFGPSTESILSEMKRVSHPRLKYIDRSSFKVNSDISKSTNRPDDIAIVGMGVNFPRGKGQNELWETLSTGLNAVTEIPGSRFDVSKYYSTDEKNKDRTMPVQEGAFLTDVWGFDNSFFNISPREAKSMDPQQRIILSTTQAALEDAGYVSNSTPSFQRASIGCFVGVATGDYVDNLKNSTDVFYSPGTLRAFHSGRISYIYKFSGPCMTIDTACSSSLVSVYQACRALQSRDCTSAIAGGVNVVTSPDMYLGLSRGHFLSSKGGCKPFDEAADGYGRAEGCGMFVLKRLEDAVAENDRIHGLIKGIQANQSGNSHSITHPHSETQIELLRCTLERSNIDPASVNVVEAHGTGTQAGDTREMSSLRTVFEKSHSKTNPLIVSSIKGNIGHCEAASGAAGLAKLLLMLKKKEIPMQANLHTLNPQLGDLEMGSIIVPRKLMPWTSGTSQPRRAVLNNFGAAGSNVALLLEESVEPLDAKPILEDRAAYVFNLSAKSKDALSVSVESYQQYLADSSSQRRLKDICYTATARRQLYSHRISVSCSSIAELQAKITEADLENTQYFQDDGPIVFVFSGQGSLYHGMGKELMKSSSVFRDSILLCDKHIQDSGFPSILEFICVEQSSTKLSDKDEIISSQCACIAVEYALAQLLISWNIVPEYLAGHSLGEYAALAVSGALTIQDSLYIVANRALMMAQKCVPNNSGMVACKLSLSKADVMLAENDKLCDMSVACRNSDDDCVFAGPLEQLGYFLEICSKEGIRAKQLDVPYGFHSASMEPIVTPLKELCKSIKWSTPLIPVASNVLGRLFTPEDFTSDYFALHARRPVRFGDIIQNLKEQEAFNKAIILEIGAHPTTLPMIRGALDTSCQCLPTMKKEKDTWELLNAILGHFFKTRDSIKWRQVFEEDVRITDLPQYPLTNTNFVVPFEEISHMAVNSEQNPDSYIDTGFDLLPRLLKSEALSKEDSMQFETTTEILGPLIKGHNVGGTAICPASVFHELALEAAHVAMPPSEERLLVVRDMKFTHPLICIPREVSKVVRVYLVKTKIDAAADASEVKVMINVVQDNEESLCCTSFVSKETPTRVKRNLLRNGAMVDRQSSYLLNEHVPHNTFHKKLLYETIFARVVKYSPEYQSLIKLSLADSNYEAIGSFTLPESSRVEDFISPPVFTDTLLHAAGFAANLSVSSDEICICGHVESVEALNGFDYTQRFTVYCTLVDADDSTILADAYALNKTRQAVAIIRGMEFKKLRLSSFQRVLQHAMPASETNRARTESPPDLSYSTSATPPPGESGVATPENVPMDNHQGIKDSMNSTISQIYGSSDLDANKSLDALGIDSQMQIEIASKLAEAFPGNNISQSDILGCGTLKALEDLLILKIQPVNPEGLPETLSEGNSDVLQIAKLQPNPMQLQFSDSTESPIFLIHDGSGQASLYSRLQNLNRDVFAFSDPYFPRNASKITSLEQMAEDYASCVSKSQSPSLIIGGWSFGGVVAFQAAQLLSKAGFEVKGLLLIDSPYPRKHKSLPEEIITNILKAPSSERTEKQSNLITEFKENAALLAQFEPRDYDPREQAKIKTVYLRSQETFDTEAVCGVHYDWLSNQQARDTAVHGWEALVGGHVKVMLIPGNHFQPFDADNIAATSEQLKKACQYIEAS